MIGGVVVAGILTAVPEQVCSSIGYSITTCLLVALTIYLPVTIVIRERLAKTLPFTMSLPISPIEYAASKIVANLLLYLMPWTIAGVNFALIYRMGSWSVIQPLAGYMDLFLVLSLVEFMLVVGFTIVFESIGWTVFLTVLLMLVLTNTGIQVVPRIPAARHFVVAMGRPGPEHNWTLGAEFAAIVLIVAVTFLVQARKRDFL
jgi:hypothetical protein